MTLEKKCFKCGVTKTLDNFYAHPEMADGRLGKCKECTKSDIQANYRKRKEHYSEYDRQRAKSPQRKSWRTRSQRSIRQRLPHKTKARQAVSRAVRNGSLVRMPCEKCGNVKSEGHHDDYSKQLEVRWLCRKHHREHHQETHTKSREIVETTEIAK